MKVGGWWGRREAAEFEADQGAQTMKAKRVRRVLRDGEARSPSLHSIS